MFHKIAASIPTKNVSVERAFRSGFYFILVIQRTCDTHENIFCSILGFKVAEPALTLGLFLLLNIFLPFKVSGH